MVGPYKLASRMLAPAKSGGESIVECTLEPWHWGDLREYFPNVRSAFVKVRLSSRLLVNRPTNQSTPTNQESMSDNYKDPRRAAAT